MKSLISLAGYGIGIAFTLVIPALAQSTSNTYPPEYKQQYLQECMSTAMQEGLAEPEANQLCNCTLTEFQQKYSFAEFQELSTKSATDETAANALFEVGEMCFESILYEE